MGTTEDVLFRALPEAVIVADRDGTVIQANDAVVGLLGWEPDELVGQPVTAIIPPRFRAAHERAFQQCIETGTGRYVGDTLALSALRRHGDEVEVELVLARTDADAGEVVIGSLRRSTPRVALSGETVISRDLVRILAEHSVLADTCRAVAASIGESLGWTTAAVWLADPEGDRLRCEAFWHDAAFPVEGFAAHTQALTPMLGVGVPGRVWETEEPVWITDLADHDNFPRFESAAADGLRSALAFPLRGPDGIVGVIELFSRSLSGRERDEEMLDTLVEIGGYLGGFFEQQLAEEQQRLAAYQRDLALEAVDMGMWRWEIRTERVTWDARMEALFGVPEGTFEATYEAYQALLHPEDRERVLATVAHATETQSRYEMVHRVLWRDGTTHWLNGFGRPFHDPSGSMLGMVGVVLDITERKAHEHEATRLAERLAFAAEASTALSQSLDIVPTTATVADLAVGRFADWCGVIVPSTDHDAPVVAVSHRHPGQRNAVSDLLYDSASAPEDAPLAALASCERVGTLADLPSPTVAAMRARVPVSAFLCVPLRARGEVIGTVVFARDEDSEPFSSEERLLAEELARRAAPAIDNSRLFAEQRDLARRLQENLLPRRLPEIAGIEFGARYRAAGHGALVGGDFYDVFALDETRWALSIGDVCGQGPEAAGVTAIARHTLRAIAASKHSPAETLFTLNDVLRQHELGGRFITIALAALEQRDDGSHVTLSQAGHPDPILLRSDGTTSLVTESRGTLLGMFAAPQLRTTTLVLHEGDALVLYTDGITELRCDDEQFGATRLADVVSRGVGISADALAQSIIDAALEFHGSTSRPDDLAVLVVRKVAG